MVVSVAQTVSVSVGVSVNVPGCQCQRVQYVPSLSDAASNAQRLPGWLGAGGWLGARVSMDSISTPLQSAHTGPVRAPAAAPEPAVPLPWLLFLQPSWLRFSESPKSREK
jgi:hypothetical protein